jgi:hypothetical protein
MVFMAWLTAVFAWFGASVLRGRRNRFAFGALVAGWIAIAAFNVINPDALIVRVNADRVAAGDEFDVSYALRLGADAVPNLIAVLPSLPAPDRCRVAETLLDRWSAPDRDWRVFSFGRWSAARAVQTSESQLRSVPCDPVAEPGG